MKKSLMFIVCVLTLFVTTTVSAAETTLATQNRVKDVLSVAVTVQARELKILLDEKDRSPLFCTLVGSYFGRVSAALYIGKEIWNPQENPREFEAISRLDASDAFDSDFLNTCGTSAFDDEAFAALLQRQEKFVSEGLF